MNINYKIYNRNLFFRMVTAIILAAFCMESIGPIPIKNAQAQGLLTLPPIGTMITPSPAFVPPALKGMIIDPKNPFKFDFVLTAEMPN